MYICPVHIYFYNFILVYISILRYWAMLTYDFGTYILEEE